MQNLVTVADTVCAHAKSPKKLSVRWYPSPLW